MSDRLLKFSPVNAGDARACWHVYYRGYYVGIINPAGARWRVWLHELRVGEFEALDGAKRAVAEWYYGPDADG